MKVRAPEQGGKVAPLRRRSGGAITPTIPWRLYAENLVAPLRRQSGGALTPTMKWLLNAENSQQDLYDNYAYVNTCAVRVSIALLSVGYNFPGRMRIKAGPLKDRTSMRTTGQCAPVADHLAEELTAISQRANVGSDFSYILTRRFKEDFGNKSLYEHVGDDCCVIDEVNNIKLQYLIRQFLSAPSRSGLLKEIRRLYAVVPKYDERYFYMQQYQNENIAPYHIAREIMVNCKDYPKALSALAEKSCRAHADQKTKPIGKIAVKDRWFAEN